MNVGDLEKEFKFDAESLRESSEGVGWDWLYCDKIYVALQLTSRV